MTKEKFKLLLTDLYKIYNPDYLQFIPDLVEKYHGMEVDAISMVLTKYNHRSKPWYDEAKDTEDYKFQLIKDYSANNRVLEGIVLDTSMMIKKEAIIEQEKLKSLEEEKSKINEKLDSINSAVEDKIKSQEESINKLIQGKLEEFAITLTQHIDNAKEYINDKKDLFEGCDFTTNIINYDTKVNLPPAIELACMGVGSRLVTTDIEGKIIGLQVTDILYDIASVQVIGKKTLEIILEKQ